MKKRMIAIAAATMAFSATAFAGTSSPYSLNINGKAANGEVLVLVPLRETAEQLGFKVSYNKGTILVDDGIMHTNLTIGKNTYQVVTSNPDLVGMSAPFSLSSAPVMTNGKTYVPIELFVPLTGNDSSIIKTDGSAISISKKADTKNEDVQIPNPLTEHETLADLAKTVGFDVTLPAVDKAYKEKDQQEKAVTRWMLAILSLFVIILIVLSFYFYYWMKKLSLMRKNLYMANRNLVTANQELAQTGTLPVIWTAV